MSGPKRGEEVSHVEGLPRTAARVWMSRGRCPCGGQPGTDHWNPSKMRRTAAWGRGMARGQGSWLAVGHKQGTDQKY